MVIDAGHGGNDPGGRGRHCREKDIALNVSRLLANGIKANYPDIRVILTREDDTFIPLEKRADIANAAEADLFISIHANIAGNHGVQGTDVYVMGNGAERENLDVTKRENARMSFEDKEATESRFDPNSIEGHIIMKRLQGETHERSIAFAGLVDNAFMKYGRPRRGVKQANFSVLRQTMMPSVLVELGFMSNREEESYLMSHSGQATLADALLDGFNAYHERIVGNAVSITRRPPLDIREVTTDQWRAEGVSEGAVTYEPNVDKILPASPAPAVSEGTETTQIGLQLIVTSKPIDLSEARWNQVPYTITEVREAGLYKYQIRGLADGASARAVKRSLIADGIDSVVVAYKGSERLYGSALRLALGE